MRATLACAASALKAYFFGAGLLRHFLLCPAFDSPCTDYLKSDPRLIDSRRQLRGCTGAMFGNAAIQIVRHASVVLRMAETFAKAQEVDCHRVCAHSDLSATFLCVVLRKGLLAKFGDREMNDLAFAKRIAFNVEGFK